MKEPSSPATVSASPASSPFPFPTGVTGWVLGSGPWTVSSSSSGMEAAEKIEKDEYNENIDF